RRVKSTHGVRAISRNLWPLVLHASDSRVAGRERSPGTFATSREDGLHQPVWQGVLPFLHLAGCQASQPDRCRVIVQIRHALGADGQVLLEYGPFVCRQSAVDVLPEKIQHFTTRHHGFSLRKCGSSSVRNAWRARWSRVLTTGTVTPSSRAVSS